MYIYFSAISISLNSISTWFWQTLDDLNLNDCTISHDHLALSVQVDIGPVIIIFSMNFDKKAVVLLAVKLPKY